MFFAALDGEGALRWSRHIGNALWNDAARGLAVTKDGAIAFTGVYQSGAPASGDRFASVVGMLEGDTGATRWMRSLASGGTDQLRELVELTGGDLIAAGYMFFSTAELVIHSLSASGDLKWSKTARIDGFAIPEAAIPFGDGVLMAVVTNGFADRSDILLLHVDAAGEVVWQTLLGGEAESEWPFALTATEDGGAIVAGRTGAFGADGDDLWLVSIDAAGAIRWQSRLSGPGLQEARGIAVGA